MSKKEIIRELEVLGSPLAGLDNCTPYRVPDGYFENFPVQVLNRIKALGTENAAEELNYLSPLLHGISKISPYSVPYEFFGDFERELMSSIHQQDEFKTADEEISSLSPLLSGIRKQNPYSAPAGYFENLENHISRNSGQPAKLIPMRNRKWLRYAVAAVLIGIITMTGIRILNNTPVDPVNTTTAAGIDLNNVSTADINNFIQITDEDLAERDKLASSVKTDIKNLLQDVSDKDIQDFLSKTSGGNDEADADIFLN
jgi:hypothetical protein